MAWLTRLGWLVGGRDTDVNIVMVGLANSGKSTLMKQLKPKDTTMEVLSPLIPLAMPVERFKYKSITLAAFDLIEQPGFGNPWEDLYKHCHGIIFVVDSADRLNNLPVQMQLKRLLQHALIKEKPLPILVLANKMDLTSSVSQYQLTDLLGLSSISDKPWQAFSTDALTGEGLSEALDWLALKLKTICRK